MVCPYCKKQETNVVDSRKNNERNSIRRRRECPKCNLKVAYLRFASVYKEFSDASDFEKEVAEL